MKNVVAGFMSVSLVLFVGFGCGLRNLLPKKGQYFEGDAAQKAAAGIKTKIGKPFKVIEVFIDDNEFRVQAQNPDNPKNIDEYKYIGGILTGPSPVKLDALHENVDQTSFPFDDIDFAAIPKFTKEAIDKAGIEGGKIYRLTFQRGFALTDKGAGNTGNAYWNIEIEGTRENVTAAADPKGNLIGVDISRTSKAADYQLVSKPELQKAQDALKRALAARPIEEIVIYDKFLMCKVPNKENPKVTDEYKYDINGLSQGGLTNLPSMKMPGAEDFSINDIDLTKAVDLTEKAKQRLGIANGVLSLIKIDRSSSVFNKKGMRTIWDVNIKAGVNEGYVDYDNDGNEILVYKNGEKISEEK